MIFRPVKFVWLFGKFSKFYLKIGYADSAEGMMQNIQLHVFGNEWWSCRFPLPQLVVEPDKWWSRRWTESGAATRMESTWAPSGFRSPGFWGKMRNFSSRENWKQGRTDIFQGSHFLPLWLGLCWRRHGFRRGKVWVAKENICDIPFINKIQ